MRTSSRGFTLLEVLVVIVVIGLFAATVVLSIRVVPEDRELKQQIERLAALLQLTSEEALLQGRDYGLRILPHGYDFLVYDQFVEEWLPIAGDDLFRPRDLGEDLEFQLKLEDRELLLKPAAPGTPPRPHILVMSSGELSPFELRLLRERSDIRMTLVGYVDGTLSIRTPNETER